MAPEWKKGNPGCHEKRCCTRCAGRTPSVYRATFDWQRDADPGFHYTAQFFLSKTTTDYDGTALAADSCVWAVTFAPTDEDGAWCAEANAIYLRLLDPTVTGGVAMLLEVLDTRTTPATVIYRAGDSLNLESPSNCDQSIGMAWADGTAGFVVGTCGDGSSNEAVRLDPVAYSCCPCESGTTTSDDEPPDVDTCQPTAEDCCPDGWPEYMDVTLRSVWTNRQFHDANGWHDLCTNCAGIANTYTLRRRFVNNICFYQLCTSLCMAGDGYNIGTHLLITLRRLRCNPSPVFPEGACYWDLYVQAATPSGPPLCQLFNEGEPPALSGKTEAHWTTNCMSINTSCYQQISDWNLEPTQNGATGIWAPCDVINAPDPTIVGV